MELIRALSSKGSHASESSSRHEFKPDRSEVWSVQFMGQRSRIVNWTELRGEIYNRQVSSLTRPNRNLIYKMVFQKAALGQLRIVHLHLLNQMKVNQRVLQEQGILYDREFPESLREFFDTDQWLNKVDLTHELSLLTQEDIDILVTQLLSLKTFLS
jgi:hypothetical protein